MISILSSSENFNNKNFLAWREGWEYWYKKGYIHSGVKEFIKEEVYRIFLTKGKKLIISDIGCGSAWLYKEVREFSKYYYGIDFNEELILRLNEDYKEQKNCKFINVNLDDDYCLDIQCDIAVVCLSIVEITDLDKFFRNLRKILKKNASIIIIGLNPIYEMIRDSCTFDELLNHISVARNSNVPAIISKNMNFNNYETDFIYHRIIYSFKDILDPAIRSGMSFFELNDQLNYHSSLIKSPIYFSLKLKN